MDLPQDDGESALSRAIRMAAQTGNELRETQRGLDPDFLIQDAVATVMRRTYEPFDRPLKMWMDDVELANADNLTGVATIPAQIRKQLQMIGTTFVSWNVQGFGGKQQMLDTAKESIVKHLLEASAAFADQPNLMPQIDEDAAKAIADQLEAGIRQKIETMRARASQSALGA